LYGSAAYLDATEQHRIDSDEEPQFVSTVSYELRNTIDGHSGSLVLIRR